ncbi:MAG: isoamylase [Bacteroidales bacterium]|nr:isoamylase [Bacteroidales bacterium]
MKTNDIHSFKFHEGRPEFLGATVMDGGVNFAIRSRNASSCTLHLFELAHISSMESGAISADKVAASIVFPQTCRFNDTFAIFIENLDFTKYLYSYTFDGPFSPQEGHLFDKGRLLADPYARMYSGFDRWAELSQVDEKGRRVVLSAIVEGKYDWGEEKAPGLRDSELVIYELNVHNFSYGGSNEPLKGKLDAVLEKIPYLKDLGVNCVELLPIFEFDELDCKYRAPDGGRLHNVWGYNSIGYFAPKASYLNGGTAEEKIAKLKDFVKEMHAAGIEVILDVVYNHSPEYDRSGEYISYRGIDNKSYYILSQNGEYVDYTGCHNTIDCNGELARRMIIDSLCYWAAEFHIDGFRFDLASVFYRHSDGSAIVDEISRHPVLSKVKLIAEPWDAAGLYQLGSFGADVNWDDSTYSCGCRNRWSEWNGRYRDTIRRFVKGDGSVLWNLKESLCGSPDLYAGQGRGSRASVNFVTAHDGFTLMDLVSFNSKHTKANGEDGRDGSDDNFSWNCGYEGIITDEMPAACGNGIDPESLIEVNSLRIRQIKNFITLLMVSRGIPMILAGDEFGNSQKGNNNAYCQDNELSWVEWENLEKNARIHRFFKRMIAFRKANPVLSSPDHYKYKACESNAYPDLSWHGCKAWNEDENYGGLCLGMLVNCSQASVNDKFIYVIMNMHWEAHPFELPEMPGGMKWHVAVNTSMPEPEDIFETGCEPVIENKMEVLLGARSIMVLVCR